MQRIENPVDPNCPYIVRSLGGTGTFCARTRGQAGSGYDCRCVGRSDRGSSGSDEGESDPKR